MQLQSPCPICDTTILLPENTVESERLSCSDCNNFVVVGKIENNQATLIEAPAVEEDWGQ
jgi:hypothetical protein